MALPEDERPPDATTGEELRDPLFGTALFLMIPSQTCAGWRRVSMEGRSGVTA
jgi:hypothetical protein